MARPLGLPRAQEQGCDRRHGTCDRDEPLGEALQLCCEEAEPDGTLLAGCSSGSGQWGDRDPGSPGGRGAALCSTCVLRRFIVQPAGPSRWAFHA